ncbi:tetratricopeptide repeat protein [Nonomuraea sp. NPDC049714]|uniref:tetratricopeptide repeat protein n=1 Tax=Nonomuraea sp. NPDC049714 TaxID=3364357 RepID=UPI0037B5E2B4
MLSLALIGVGMLAFLADTQDGPSAILDVLDKRASVVSMVIGGAGLLISGAALWAQLRSPGLRTAMNSATSRPSAVIGDGTIVLNAASVGRVGGVHLSPRPAVASRPVRLTPRPPQLAGRDEVLAALHRRLTAADDLPCMVTVYGLGGVGKTSLVVEYGHRYEHEYGLVWQLPAEDPTTLSAAFADLAAVLNVRDMLDVAGPVHRVHAALAAQTQPWLLIFDDVAEADLLRAFLPPAGPGHVLITSRSAHWPPGQGLDLPVLEWGPATAFLLARTGQDDNSNAVALVEELGALPLALEQAGAYMADTGTSLVDYLRDLGRQRAAMLDEGEPWGYPARVASTWRLAFDRLTDSSPQAIELLRLLACCAPDAIPYRLLLRQLDDRSPLELLDDGDLAHESEEQVVAVLRGLPHFTLDVNAAVSALRRYGLIGPPINSLVSVHRLVQAVTLDRLPAAQRTCWQVAAAALLRAALPQESAPLVDWPLFKQLVPHALTVLPPGAAALDKVADYLGVSGDYRTATTLYRRIHHELVTSLGVEHPRTLTVQYDLAYWMGQAGGAASAREGFAELLPVRGRVLGVDHPDTLATRRQLAYWTGEAGDWVAARDQLADLLPVRQLVSGADHPDTLATRHELAYWTGEAGDKAAARDLLAELLPVRERVLGVDHPDSLATRHELARWTGWAGDAGAAREGFAELLPVRERVLGVDHPDSLATRHELARWTGRAGDAGAAREGFAELLPVRERVLGVDHPDTLATWHNLANWTGEAGDPLSARDQLAALLPIRQRVSGIEHPDTLDTWHQWARWTGWAGDPVVARDQIAALLPIWERIFGYERALTVELRRELAFWVEKAAPRRGKIAMLWRKIWTFR